MTEELSVAEELDLYAGGEKDDEEEVTGDRGDNLEDSEPEVTDEGDEPTEETKEDPEDGKAEEEPEPEAAAEETPDAPEGEDDNVDEPIPPPPEVSNVVSKDRFEQVNERMKAAEDKLRALESEKTQEPVVEFDFDGKELEYMELVTDGEFEKAKAVRNEIRTAEQQQFEAKVAEVTNQATGNVDTRIEFTRKTSELEAEFPAFNPQSESYDQLLVDEVVARQAMYLERGGTTPAEALDKAAREVAVLYNVESALEKPADETPPPPPAPKKPDVKKKIEQAKKQPPKLEEGISDEETTPAVSEMTDAEFDALPEATKARLRGDYG